MSLSKRKVLKNWSESINLAKLKFSTIDFLWSTFNLSRFLRNWLNWSKLISKIRKNWHSYFLKPWASREWSAIRFSSENWLCLFKCGSKYAIGNVELNAPKQLPNDGRCLSISVFKYFLKKKPYTLCNIFLLKKRVAFWIIISFSYRSCVSVASIPKKYRLLNIL